MFNEYRHNVFLDKYNNLFYILIYYNMTNTHKIKHKRNNKTRKNEYTGGALPKVFKRSQVQTPDVNELAGIIYSVVADVEKRLSDTNQEKNPYVDSVLNTIFSSQPLSPTSKGKSGTIYIINEKPDIDVETDTIFEPFALKTFSQPKTKEPSEPKSFMSSSFSINELFDSNNLLKSKTQEVNPSGDSSISIFSQDTLRSLAGSVMNLQGIRHRENYDMIKYKYLDYQTCLTDILLTFISFTNIYGIDCELKYLKDSIRTLPSLQAYNLDFDSFLNKFNVKSAPMKGGKKITNGFPQNEVIIQQVLSKVIEFHNDTNVDNNRLIQFKDYFMDKDPYKPANPAKKTLWIVENVCGLTVEEGKYITTFNKLIRYLLQCVKDVQDLNESGDLDMKIDVTYIIDIVIKLTNDFFEFLKILKSYVGFQHTDLKNENIFVLYNQPNEISSVNDLKNAMLVLADLDKARIDYIYNRNEPGLPQHVNTSLTLLPLTAAALSQTEPTEGTESDLGAELEMEEPVVEAAAAAEGESEAAEEEAQVAAVAGDEEPVEEEKLAEEEVAEVEEPVAEEEPVAASAAEEEESVAAAAEPEEEPIVEAPAAEAEEQVEPEVEEEPVAAAAVVEEEEPAEAQVAVAEAAAAAEEEAPAEAQAALAEEEGEAAASGNPYEQFEKDPFAQFVDKGEANPEQGPVGGYKKKRSTISHKKKKNKKTVKRNLGPSCEQCRASKVKCSRTSPCDRCTKRNITCTPHIRKN